MKALNNTQFISTVYMEVRNKCKLIESADSFEKAEMIAFRVMGTVDCMITYLNTMICTENNGFTAELDETLDSWCAEIYQSLINKAEETKQDRELLNKLYTKRDEFLG